MSKGLIYFYYNHIVFYSKKYNHFDSVEQNTDNIILQLEKIINSNLDYLLTESFLSYICHDGLIDLRLYRLHYDYHERIGTLEAYFKNILDSHGKNDIEYIKLLDNNTKEAIIKAHNSINYLFNNFNNYHYRLYDVKHIIYIVLALCMVNNCMNDFEKLTNIFLEDPYKTLEDLYINGIRNPMGASINDDNNILIDRVINKIKNSNVINK